MCLASAHLIRVLCARVLHVVQAAAKPTAARQQPFSPEAKYMAASIFTIQSQLARRKVPRMMLVIVKGARRGSRASSRPAVSR
jgi:hypothetical protein